MGKTLADGYLEIRADLDKLGAEMRRGIRSINFNQHGRDAGRQLGAGMSKGFGDSGVFSTVTKVMASRFALIGATAAAAAPGVLQLTGALAPAAGIVAGVPIAITGAVAALGTFKVATSQVSDAIGKGLYGTTKAYNEALADLPPAAQAATKAIVALKPQIQALRQELAQNFFKPLVDDLKPLVGTYFPLLRTEMGAVSGRLGAIVKEFTTFARTEQAVGAVRAAFQATGDALANATTAVQPLSFGLAALITSTAPLLRDMGTSVGTLGVRFGDWLRQVSESGAALQVFNDAKAVLGDLFAIVKNLGSIFYSVMSAASDGGFSLLTTIRDLTKQAADWLKTMQGAHFLLVLFEGMNAFGAALRTSLAAVLPAIGVSLAAMGPALVELAGAGAQLIVALAPLLTIAAGLAATVIKELTPALTALAGWIGRNHEAVKVAAVAIVAFTVAMKAAGLAAAISAAGGMASWIASTVLGTTTTAGLSGATTAFGVALRFALGPIGLIITAVGLLAAGFVYLFNHNKTFHDFVITTWNNIKTNVAGVVSWFTGTALPLLKGVWQGISTHLQQSWEVMRPIFERLVAVFRDVVAPTITWLWKNIVGPALTGIGAYISFMWENVGKPVFEALWAVITNVIAPTITWLWKNIVGPAFTGIGFVIKTMWAVAELVLAVMVAYFRNVVAPVMTWLWKNVVAPVMQGIGERIQAAWNFIRPIFEALGNFIRDKVAPVFKSNVDAIGKAWEGLQELARKPIAFVVNHVINPLISGFNKVAGVFGTTQVKEISGFASGGRIPGAPSSVDNRFATMISSAGRALAPLWVATGEYIVNAASTSKWLPLLEAINGKGTPYALGGLIPGMASGGLVDWAKNAASKVFDVISDPAGSLRGVANAAISAIPGGGGLRDVLVSSSQRLVSAAIEKIKSLFSFGGGGAAGNWPSSPGAQRGDSGVWRSIVALIKATGPISGSFGNGFRPGDPLWHGSGRAVDWMGFNQDLLATFLAIRKPLELIHRTRFRDYAYTRGVNKGSFSNALMEAHRNHIHIAMAKGGLIPTMDRGGSWPSGTVRANMSGHTEQVLTGGPNGDVVELRELLAAILMVLRGMGGDVADALASNTRRAVQLGRGRGIPATGLVG